MQESTKYEIKRNDEDIAHLEAWAERAFETGETHYPGNTV